MNRKNLLVKYDKEMRLRMMYPEARKEITSDVVRFVRTAPGMNLVGFTFAVEPELERVIDQQLDYFVPMRQPFTWKVYDHDHLPSLGEKLTKREFIREEDPRAVMVFNLRNTPSQLSLSEEDDVRRISTQNELMDLIHVVDEVYSGDNSLLKQRLHSHMNVPGYLSVYAAFEGNQPVSIAWTYFPYGQFAALSAGHQDERSYLSLLTARLSEIRERGYRYAVLETSPTTQPNYEAHGFNQLTTVRNYQWTGN
ncbi:MAG TPA: hypothetical protein VFQ23_17990 [Anaerolineales bacterium]|nr:hypothetical protein [Anaerolineales bacterium]